MGWHERPMVAFDVETTGVDYEEDRIVTAAAVIVEDGANVTDWLVDPGVEIPAEATAVHGVSTERARDEGMDAAEAVDAMVALLAQEVERGSPVVAFNARFDLTFLDREARRHGLPTLGDLVGEDALMVIDPLVLDKGVDRYRKGSRKLTACCQHYSVVLGEDAAHEAGADALAAARVAYRIAQRHPQVRDLDLADLHELQATWAADQAASLESYLRSQGKAETIEGAWPVVPLSAAAA